MPRRRPAAPWARPVPALDRRPPPMRPACRRDSRCRHWACRPSPTDQAAGRGSCDRAGDRPPCRCDGMAGRAGQEGSPLHGGDGSTAAYLSAAWHCRQAPSPGPAWRPCVSRASPQVTPAANILLCLKERKVDLVAHLAVGMVEPAGQRRHRVRVGQRPWKPTEKAPRRRGTPQSRPPCAAWPARKLRTALPVAGLIGQEMPRRSSNQTSSPIFGSSFQPNGHQLCRERAQGGVPRAPAVAGLANPR